jgi:GAF domain-containing protein
VGISEHDPAAPADATQALEQLGRLSLRDQSMEGLLLTVSRMATAVLPGAAEASVCLLIGGRPTTPVFTGQLAMDLDESQYGHGHGPCLHAADSGEMVLVTDARTETRWTDYMRSAVERGSLSSLSVPLPVREGVSGALNIYGLEANAFDERSRSVAAKFAPYAAVAAGNLFEYQTARELADNLQRALESRAIIDQAKGILMERHKLTADQAFQLLAHVSMQANIKVRAVAEHLVGTGDLPRP